MCNIMKKMAITIAKFEALALIPSMFMSAVYSLMFSRDMIFDFWWEGLYDNHYEGHFPVDEFFMGTGEIFMQGIPYLAVVAVVVAIVAVVVTVRNNKK